MNYSLRLLIVVNVDWFFCSHRLPIAIAALQRGYEVHIATTFTSQKYKRILAGYGFFLHDLKIDRSGKSLIAFLYNFVLVFKLLRKLKPDILHLVTIQPVLAGGLAAKLAGVKRTVFAISGLGHVFLVDSAFSRIRCSLVRKLYFFALSTKYRYAIFQNSQDQRYLSTLCSLGEHESCLIPGSGVDLSLFTYKEIQETIPIVLMASRLLLTKGAKEFVAAAKILKDRRICSRFQLVGEPDRSNPAAVSIDDLNNWQDQGLVEVLGHRSDLHELMSEAHIICLPSYYPEGLPKVLCEAAACGRVVVTTDEPGCRDAIENGVTGLLVPSRDSLALANAFEHLLLNPELIRRMGAAGRKRAERYFDINAIVDQHLDIYESLLASS